MKAAQPPQPLIVSYSGIRGIVGQSLTAEVALRFGRAFGRLVTRRHARPTILLARDTRPSGPELQRSAVEGLAPFGRLVNLGVVPTPTLQFAMRAFAAEAALCVTASHNPMQWNGLKFFLGPENTILDAEEMKELDALSADAAAPPQPPAPPAAVEDRHDEAIRLHVTEVCAQVDVTRIRARGFRVALDSAGGAGAEATCALLETLGCDVVAIASTRESEPLPEHLTDLCRAVLEHRCDAGLAQDLDADRLALVTERGDAPGEDYTLVLAVDHLLRRFAQGTRIVVKNVATTRAVDDVVEQHRATLIETPVGEVNLSRALLRETRRGHVAFGGEGNGGVIFPPVSLGRDSLVGAALILDGLAGDVRPLSQWLLSLPHYHAKKARLALTKGRAFDPLLDRIQNLYPEGTASRLDGLKLRFADGSWFAVRPSNTEPIVRVVAESPSAAWVEETVERIENLLHPSDPRMFDGPVSRASGSSDVPGQQ